MSEDTTAQAAPDADAADNNDSDDLSPEELRAELTRVRREAAGRRVANRELEEKAKKFDEIQREQMSEVERLRADLADAQKSAADASRERLARKVAKAAGLDADDADLITGASEDEMRASAERLAARFAERSSTSNLPNNGLFGGSHGKPVAAHRASDAGDAFRKLFTQH